jgi:two-component system OmpR family sensor kinase
MRRISLRGRLTLVFAAAMAVVLAATGFLLYNRLGSSLDGAIDQGLRARGADVAALVRQADNGLSALRPTTFPGSGGAFAQVLDRNGKIFDETPGLDHEALLTPAQLRRALVTTVRVPRFGDGSEAVRLLAAPITAQGQKLVVVVGAPLGSRDQALANLRQELLVGGPIALLVASLLGYLLAGAALRPVERMRARADAISAHDLSDRLPVGPARDEIATLGETLNALLDRIETARTRERHFVADASHELRTPLALVRAEVELALERPRSEAELETALRSVGEEADRLSQLAEDLLLLARLDEGVLHLRVAPTDLDGVIDGIATRFERRARDDGRIVEVVHGGLHVNADRPRLEQALANLVENALRHGAGTIRIFAREQGGGVEIHVTDEGPGFPPAFAARAFERFTRGDDARSGPGAGLGLAIVQTVAHAHGGRAVVGDGADVWLIVPAA